MILTRYESGPQGTFGRLGKWHTLEREWLDNRFQVSCIPTGTYKVVWVPSPKLRRCTYRLLGTEPRSGILIHSASLATQLQGCIALGEKLGRMDGVKCILVSRPAVREFEALMGQKPFILEIRNA